MFLFELSGTVLFPFSSLSYRCDEGSVEHLCKFLATTATTHIKRSITSTIFRSYDVQFIAKEAFTPDILEAPFYETKTKNKKKELVGT